MMDQLLAARPEAGSEDVERILASALPWIEMLPVAIYACEPAGGSAGSTAVQQSRGAFATDR